MKNNNETIEIKDAYNKVIEAIDELNDVIAKRIKSSNYKNLHKSELNFLRKDLLDMQLKLIELRGYGYERI